MDKYSGAGKERVPKRYCLCMQRLFELPDEQTFKLTLSLGIQSAPFT